MSFELLILLMITSNLFWINFNISRLNDRLETISEILLDNSNDEEEDN